MVWIINNLLKIHNKIIEIITILNKKVLIPTLTNIKTLHPDEHTTGNDGHSRSQQYEHNNLQSWLKFTSDEQPQANMQRKCWYNIKHKADIAVSATKHKNQAVEAPATLGTSILMGDDPQGPVHLRANP